MSGTTPGFVFNEMFVRKVEMVMKYEEVFGYEESAPHMTTVFEMVAKSFTTSRHCRCTILTRVKRLQPISATLSVIYLLQQLHTSYQMFRHVDYEAVQDVVSVQPALKTVDTNI